jgi:hypothetical protein
MARKNGTDSRGKSARSLPPLDQIAEDAPLRLNIAAALAYPDGSMTASGLRREAARADSSSSGPREKITPHLEPYGR